MYQELHTRVDHVGEWPNVGDDDRAALPLVRTETPIHVDHVSKSLTSTTMIALFCLCGLFVSPFESRRADLRRKTLRSDISSSSATEGCGPCSGSRMVIFCLRPAVWWFPSVLKAVTIVCGPGIFLVRVRDGACRAGFRRGWMRPTACTGAQQESIFRKGWMRSNSVVVIHVRQQ